MVSLKGRLSFGLTLSLVILLLLQWLIAGVAIKHLTEEQLVTRLAHDAESLLAGVQFAADGTLRLDPLRLSAVYQRPYSGHYFAVGSGTGWQFSRSFWDSTLELPQVSPGSETRIRTSGPQRQPLLVLVRGFHKQDRSITIAIAEDLSALKAGLRRFQLIYGLVSAAVLVALLLIQRLIVTRSLRPLDAVGESMRRLERGEVPRIEAAGPSEIAPLIGQLNLLLTHMGSRTRRSREALGNLAHALKTRLAILSQTGERPELAAYPQLRASIRDSTEAIRRIVERELKRARLIGDALPGQRAHLQDEVSLLTQTLQVLHADKAPSIHTDVARDARFLGDREDLLELLGNLLDNACKWCRGRVLLTVANGEGCRFIVEDDGPGCAPGELYALTQRGFRADESIPGSGLGLAIVKDVVESYGGTLAFGHSETLGGLRVEVRLPAEPPNTTTGR
jgi:signal transduction histidine kinase